MTDEENTGDYPRGFAIGEMRTEEQKRAAKSFGARCGHVKRRGLFTLTKHEVIPI